MGSVSIEGRCRPATESDSEIDSDSRDSVVPAGPSNSAVAARAAASRAGYSSPSGPVAAQSGPVAPVQTKATAASSPDEIWAKAPDGPPAPVARTASPSPSWAHPAGGGQALEPATREPMEASFGADFSNVRVHRGDGAAESIGARAFARGSDVHVAAGEPGFDTTPGRELLGHELAHVVQQRSGRVVADQGKGGINGDSGLEAEADAAGAAAARGERAVVQGATRATTPGAIAIQAKRSEVGTRHKTDEYQEMLEYDESGQLERVAHLLAKQSTDRKTFIRLADALGGLAAGELTALDRRYKRRHGNNTQTLQAAIQAVYASKPWKLSYLQNLLTRGEPSKLDKLALALGLVTHSKGERSAHRPGDAKRVLELLESDFPEEDLWMIFTLGEYEEFRVAITQMERIESRIADRIHALRRARGINVETPGTMPGTKTERSTVIKDNDVKARRIALRRALRAKKPSAETIHQEAVAYVDQIRNAAPPGPNQRAMVDYEQDRFVRHYTPPAKPAALQKALAEPVCRYPLLERLARELAGTALPAAPALEVEHLASIVRHRGRLGVERAFSGASTDKLVADVKRWLTHASEQACNDAVQNGSAFREALAEIGSGKGRGLSEHSRDFLIALVRQGGVAHTGDPNKSQDENDQDRKDRDSGVELGARIEREKVKRDTKKLAPVRRRYKHTDLNAHLDGMNHAARMSFLLEHMQPGDRTRFEDPETAATDKKQLFEDALDALDQELTDAHFKAKDRAVIRAKFTYRGDLGVNYLRLVELASKYSSRNDLNKAQRKKIYSAATKLAGNEYLQVRHDPNVVDLLKKTGSDRTAIEQLLGIDLGAESEQAYLDLDGTTEKERGDSAKQKAEHDPQHWARLIDYEIDKHSTGAPGTKGRVVNRLTVHVGRLFSFVYRAQQAAKTARPNDEAGFLSEVWAGLSGNSHGFIRHNKGSVAQHQHLRKLYHGLKDGTPITVIDRLEAADRGPTIHMSEIEQTLTDSSGEELLRDWSNFKVLENLVKATPPDTDAIAEFTLDLNPDVHHKLDSILRSFNTTKPERLVKIVAAARRKLATAVAEDTAFRDLLKQQYAGVNRPDHVDKVLAANLRAMAAIPEERLRKKGIQWHFLSVLGDETSLKFSELTGQHRAMDKHLEDDAEKHKKKYKKTPQDREKVGEKDLEKIETLEEEWGSLKTDFEAMRAKYNKRLELIIDGLITIIISVATLGTGTALGAAWWGKALIAAGGALIKEVISVIKQRIIQGGVDATTSDAVKKVIMFSVQQGMAFGVAGFNDAMKGVWGEWMTKAGLGDKTVTEPFSGQSSGVGDVTFTYATKPSVARVAADAGWKALNKVGQSIVVAGPQKLLQELLSEDPYKAVRKDFKTEAANWGLDRLREATTTFVTTFATTTAKNSFNDEQLTEQERDSKAKAKAEAEKKALTSSSLSNGYDPLQLGQYRTTHGGNKTIDQLYEEWQRDNKAGTVKTPALGALTQAQKDYDDAVAKRDGAKTAWTSAKASYDGSSDLDAYKTWASGQSSGGTVTEAEAHLTDLQTKGATQTELDQAQRYVDLAGDKAKVGDLKKEYDSAQQEVATANQAKSDAQTMQTLESNMHGDFSVRDTDTTNLTKTFDDKTKEVEDDKKIVGKRSVLFQGTLDPLISQPIARIDQDLVAPNMKVDSRKTAPGARKVGKDGDTSTHSHTRQAMQAADAERDRLQGLLAWKGIQTADKTAVEAALARLDTAYRTAQQNELAVGTSYAPENRVRRAAVTALNQAASAADAIAGTIEVKKQTAITAAQGVAAKTRTEITAAETERARLQPLLSWQGIAPADKQDGDAALAELDAALGIAKKQVKRAERSNYEGKGLVKRSVYRDLRAATAEVTSAADDIEAAKLAAEKKAAKKKRARKRRAKKGHTTKQKTGGGTP